VIRALLLGNHTVAVRALNALRTCAEVCAVVAHPLDAEDGVRYVSLYKHARSMGVPAHRFTGRDSGLAALVGREQPNLLLTVDFRYLLPTQLFVNNDVTAINLHPSLLPAYRGRAPLNWAILNGETRLGLTAHCIDEKADSGDIIAQQAFDLSATEDIGDALRKLYPLYERMVIETVALVASGRIPRRAQDHSQATVFPRRRPEDGEIDWHDPAVQVHRLVRAVAAPYPGAFGWLGQQKVMIWRAQTGAGCASSPPGCVHAECGADGFEVACGEGSLIVTRCSDDRGMSIRPRVGARFETTAIGATHA
jgi:methionyl-tRNA formyltransferase